MGLFRNTLAQSAPVLTSYVFSLVLAPIMLARLGLTQFGIWAVAVALTSYAGLLDLGVSKALARYVALYDAQGDRRGIQECLMLGLLTSVALGVLASLVAIVAAPVVAHGVHVTPGTMRVLLLSAVSILVLGMVSGVLSSVPVGLRRMVPPNMAAVAGNVVNFAVSVAVLLITPSLTTYAVANAAASALSTVFALGVLAWMWPAPRLAFPRSGRAREIIGFALKGQVIWLGELINQQTDKIVIALLVSPRAAGAFEIANRVVLAVRSTGILTISAMIPTATAAIVSEGVGFLRDFYRRYTQKSVAIAFPLFGIACVSAPFLLLAWLGTSPRDSEIILVMLSLSYPVNVATGVAMTLATSDGRPGLPARAAAVTSLLNVVATVALAPVFGLWGVLLGTVAALTIGNTLFLVRFHRLYGFPYSDLLRSAGPPGLLAVALGMPFVIVYAVTGTHLGSRPEAVVGLVLTAGTYGLAYWLAASRLGYLPEQLRLGRLWRRLRPRAQTAA